MTTASVTERLFRENRIAMKTKIGRAKYKLFDHNKLSSFRNFRDVIL